ncbi:MAG: cyclic nucleotide-binding domain-containing protein [Cytophagales bacterium]|nr:cyclic nucleotide-binding domain-containing protein [Cytophagales bacterium]MDW8385263.1 cyclic nucleotide-binding domain-containing protein [Flammeovirgaceae bacterium]
MKWNPFKKSYTVQELRMVHFLKRNHLFSTLSEREIIEFIPYLYERKYAKNEVVFFRGDPAQGVYFVRKGRITLSIDLEDSFEPICKLRPYDSFGDSALLPNTFRSYNAICSSESCLLYMLPTENIQEIFNANSFLSAKIMTNLARHYSEIERRLFKSYRESFAFFELRSVYEVEHQDDKDE